MARRWTRTTVVAAGALAILVGLPACGSDDGSTSEGRPSADTGSSAESGTGSATSSPFSVGPPPTGWQLAVAGTGAYEQEWSSDSVGSDEPYTVLAREGGEPGSEVVVSVTGYAGYQGGLDQASLGYMDGPDELEVDGHEARWWPGGGDGPRAAADLVVALEDDLALRVSGPGVTKDEALAIARAAEVDGQAMAPAVPDPPAGFSAAGSVDAEGLLALRADLGVAPYLAPGGAGAHAVGWVQGRARLSVVAVPGQRLDVAVARLSGAAETTSEPSQVGGRPGVRFESLPPDGVTVAYRVRTLVAETAWGDVLVLRASDGTDAEIALPSFAELEALAAGVAPSDTATWDALVAEAAGGPGLQASAGRTEVVRGEVAGIGWLAQTGEPGPSYEEFGGERRDGSTLIDGCLLLSTGDQACTTGGQASERGLIRTGPPDGAGRPPFAIVVTTVAGAAVRITRGDEVVTAELHPLPGGRTWGAVAFLDRELDLGLCDLETETDGPPARIEVLDAAGAVVGCVGP